MVSGLLLALAGILPGDAAFKSGFLMKLFYLFLGAIVVGMIIAFQVLPGLASIETMVRGIRTLSRRAGRRR